jgi:ligand-binding sensor domain-containing protein/serine phosphatase RsbU (regulator of sigma subunit)
VLNKLLLRNLTLCVCWLLLSVSFSYSQTYNFKTYSVEDGLAQSQVPSMFQSLNGLMWFGTNSGGVSSFDGIKFTNYTGKNGLVNNIVYSICDDKKGNILFGTYGGLSVYNGFSFHNFTDSTGLPHKRIYKILRDGLNRVWIGTAKGICLFDGNKIIPFKENDLLNASSVFSMYADSKGGIWFGTSDKGVFLYANHTFKQFSAKEGLSNNFIRTIIEDKQGGILIGTNNGLNRIVNGELDLTFKGPAGEQISYAGSTYDREGNIWFASGAGAFKYDGHLFRRFSEESGLGATTLYSICCDREGNMWFGTNGSGISRLSSETFFNLGTNDSLPRNYVNSIFMDSKHDMWISLQNTGVVKLNEQHKIVASYREYKLERNKETRTMDVKHLEKGICSSTINNMLETADGKIWFATGNGLSAFDGKNFTNYYVADGLIDNKLYALESGTDGRIWIGTRNGVCYYQEGGKDHATAPVLKDFPELNNMLEKDYKVIPRIYTDHHGNTWFGTEKGVIRAHGSELKIFSKKNGLTDKRVSCITEDNEGKIWFGTEEGVFLFDGTTFIKADENNGLSSNKIYLLIFDSKGFLWVGTSKGLDRLDATTFKNTLKVNVKHYGNEEGFRGVECNVNACCKDNKGRIWFGTIKGATVYDPKLDKINDVEPLTSVTKIKLFFQDADLSKWSKGVDSITHLPKDLILPFNRNHVTFDFRGISLAIPSKVRYRFKLEGIDGDWVPATAKNEATYSSLPPGEYVFLLRASNNDGVWNKEAFQYHFTILPPWYQTWWFYTLCIVVAISGVYLFIRIRTAQLIKTQIALETQVRERTSELREEKEKVEVINKEISAQKTIIETKNRDITDSIQYAKNIQEAILPQLDVISQEFPQSFILYMPKDIVSGDFYWFAKRKNKRFIATADCTGHGVPGAFMSIIGNTILNEIVTEKEILEPGEILDELHTGIKNALKQSNDEGERRDGMDIALCAMEGDSNILEYAGANRPLWIFRGGNKDQMEVIKPNKFPIGGLEMEDKRQFTNNRIELGKGDMMYLSSDGYADQFGGHAGKKMMVKNFQKLLTEILHLPLPEQKEILRKHFIDWKGDQEQVDDVLVIGFRY